MPPAITDLVVEDGDHGAGTVIRFTFKTAGRTEQTRQRVEEPEPGRVLVERDLSREMATTFTVTPTDAGARVHIETTWTGRGVRGVFEHLVAPRLLRPVYAEELSRLDRYAQEQVTA